MLQEAKWFQPLLASANISVETSSTHTLLAATGAAAGVAVLPQFVAQDEPALVSVSEPVADHDVWFGSPIRNSGEIRRCG